jgi:hypothetical protein
VHKLRLIVYYNLVSENLKGLAEAIHTQSESGKVAPCTRPEQSPQGGFSSPPPSTEDDSLPGKDLSESQHDTVDEGEDQVDTYDRSDAGDGTMRWRSEQRESERGRLIRRSRKRRRGWNGTDLGLLLIVFARLALAQRHRGGARRKRRS